MDVLFSKLIWCIISPITSSSFAGVFIISSSLSSRWWALKDSKFKSAAKKFLSRQCCRGCFWWPRGHSERGPPSVPSSESSGQRFCHILSRIKLPPHSGVCGINGISNIHQSWKCTYSTISRCCKLFPCFAPLLGFLSRLEAEKIFNLEGMLGLFCTCHNWQPNLMKTPLAHQVVSRVSQSRVSLHGWVNRNERHNHCQDQGARFPFDL